MRRPMLATALTIGFFGAALADARIIPVPEALPVNAVEAQPAPPVEPPPALPPAASPAPAITPQAAPAPPTASVPPAASTRFRFERSNEGFLRFDNENGQIAFCAPRTAGWACQVVPEDRAALEKEIARLQDEVAGLKRDIAALREPPPPPRPPAELTPLPPPPPAAKEGDKGGDKNKDLTIKLPTQEDVDRATAALQRAWDRVVDMIGQLTKDLSRKSPDRTSL